MINLLIAWVFYRRALPLLVNPDRAPELWNICKIEVGETPTILAKATDYQSTSSEILADRLTRRYDPGMAVNEAAQAALERKAEIKNDPDPVRPLTPKQEMALEFQKRVLAARMTGETTIPLEMGGFKGHIRRLGKENY